VDDKPEVVPARAGVPHFEIYSRGPEGVHWRLLSANNRDSGHSGSSFPDVDACRTALGELLGLLGELRPTYTLTAEHRWDWTLAHHDVVLARSARSFDRRLRCMAASEWFLHTAPAAVIRTALRIAPLRLADATLDIRRPFTLRPYLRYEAKLPLPGGKAAMPGGTEASVAGREGEGDGE
jgi:hypothetical protein